MTGPEEELRELFGVLGARQSGASTDGAWLRERWRRHQRRRLAAVAAALTATAVVTGAALTLPDKGGEQSLIATQPTATVNPTSSPSPPPPSPSAAPTALALPPLDQKTGVRLLVVERDDLSLLDVDTGSVTALPTDPRLQGYERINATAVGRRTVLVGDNSTGAGGGGGDVLVTSGDTWTGLRKIGSADPQLLPSATTGSIWLARVTDSDPATRQPRTELREVDLRGRVMKRVVFDNVFGATPFGSGFLRDVSLQEREAGVEYVGADGSRIQAWPGRQLLGDWRDIAVLRDVQPCTAACELTVLSAGDNVTERRVEVQNPDLVDWAASGISPDKRLLFSAVPQDDEPSIRIARTDLTSGAVTILEGVRSTRYYGFTPSFTADGRWMFFPDADKQHVNAYDIEQQRSYRVPGDFAGVTSLLVVS